MSAESRLDEGSIKAVSAMQAEQLPELASFKLGQIPRKLKKFGGRVVFHFMDVAGAEIGVASAGIVPYIPADNGRIHALVQVEDRRERDKANPQWVKALALFGGKVDEGDLHWTHTAIREMREECGALLHDAMAPLYNRVMVADPSELVNVHGATSVFVTDAKYKVLFLPVALEEVQQLPGLYYKSYEGKKSSDITPGDFTREAYCLAWVELEKKDEGGAGWVVTPTSLDSLSKDQTYPNDAAWDWASALSKLPLKHELAGALQKWAGPKP